MLLKLKRIADAALLKVAPAIIHLVKIPYWAMVRSVISHWGKGGLHSITVGEFAGGISKTRSLFREEMLLKAIILFARVRGKSCLDLACNDGFWSFRLARFGLKSVTGVDAGGDSIARANFLKYVYDFPTFRFEQKDIFEFLYDESESKSYDVVLLLSIIYHLPGTTDWDRFFGAISRINNECLIIDSRWFEDDAYWYDKTSRQAVMETEKGTVRKWRPLRKQVFDCLSRNGYGQITEINPSAFLLDSKAAYGDGNPYTLENVADYMTNNRTLIFAYKKKTLVPMDVLRAALPEPDIR